MSKVRKDQEKASNHPLKVKHQLDGVDLIPYVLGSRPNLPHDFLFWRKFDSRNYAAGNAIGNKIISSDENIQLFNLDENISENKTLVKKDSLSSQSLNKAYKDWESQMLHPTFLGLKSDKLLRIVF